MSEWVHIYSAKAQPATRFTLDIDVDKTLTFTRKPNERLRCSACWRLIPAKKLTAHAYYDAADYFCVEQEYGRSPEFPFEYRNICKGTAFNPKASTCSTRR